MKSHTTKRFRATFSELPEEIKEKGREAYRQFRADPYHPSLHFKQVHPVRPIYSVRIIRGYRAVGIIENAEIVWFWVGPHDAYLRLLAQL
jgi:hypothetical protein